MKLRKRIQGDSDYYDRYLRKKLQWFLGAVVAPSPYYKDLAVSSLCVSDYLEESISRIPLLEKQRLRHMSDMFISGKRPASYFRAHTSGSTGVPLQMWFDHEYFISYYSYFRYFLYTNNLWPDPFSVSMTTLSPFKRIIDYWVLQPSIHYSYYHRMNIHPSHWESPAAMVRHISSEAPLILRGMPSSLALLVEYLQEYPPETALKPEGIITMSETLLPSTRQKLEAEFGAQVFDEYGLSEVGGVVARECKEHKGFHIDVVDYFVEIVDPSGVPVPEGTEGEIVITNLYNRTIPLLRYRTGDYGTISREPCQCGSIAPRISKLSGRMLTRFHRPDGTTYNPFDVFGENLLSLPLSQFQMTQQGDQRITLYYTANCDISSHASLQALRRKIRQIYGNENGFRLKKLKQFNCHGKFQAFLHTDRRSHAS